MTAVLFPVLIALVVTCILGRIIYHLITRYAAGTVTILVLLCMLPFIFHFSFQTYAMFNKAIFAHSAKEYIQIAYSPMKIPVGTQNELAYCKQFSDQDGKPLSISVRDDGSYCGKFTDFDYDNAHLFLPFNRLPNNMAEYWASPSLRIIGPSPNLVKE